MTPDAVVIGAGPNGLVAANMLADAGWDVVVCEAQPAPGGAVRSGELTLPGFCHDLFSAFYPLAAVSPPLRALELERSGLRWRRAALPLAHVFDDGRAAAISTDVEETAASVERFAPGDGAGWRALHALWCQTGDAVIDSLLRPFPPVAPGLRLARRLRSPSAAADFARFTLLPVRRLAAERFGGDGAAMLLAGNTLHTDLGPESALGGFFGWLLAMLAQSVGFPVPEGGSGQLTAALVRRLEAAGGQVVCDARVDQVEVRSGRATGVRLADGRRLTARRAVLADVVAPRLFLDLVGAEHLPSRLLGDLAHFELDHGTVKLDWALRSPIPWMAPEARRAGTLHLGGDMDSLTEYSAQLRMGRIPARPFLLFGQMTLTDPSRSPPGTETAWAYTHVPTRVKGDAGGRLTGQWTADEVEAFVQRVEAEVECRAPGFRDLVIGRHVFTPHQLEAADANLVGGAVNGGTAQLHQQLIFRPTPGRAGPRTPVRGLFLASASAHPGGGVHGACGANAALAALRSGGRRRITGGLARPRSADNEPG